MRLSLGQAARLAGRGKTTLTRAIRAGRLSATRLENGAYEINFSELARVYELRHETAETVTGDRHAAHHETVARLAELETEVRMLKELLAEVRHHREELRAERDDWRSRAEPGVSDILNRMRARAA